MDKAFYAYVLIPVQMLAEARKETKVRTADVCMVGLGLTRGV